MHWDEKVSTNRSKMDRIATIIEFLKKLEKIVIENSHYKSSDNLIKFLLNNLNYLAEKDDKAYSKFSYNETTSLFFAVLLENYTMQSLPRLIKGNLLIQTIVGIGILIVTIL